MKKSERIQQVNSAPITRIDNIFNSVPTHVEKLNNVNNDLIEELGLVQPDENTDWREPLEALQAVNSVSTMTLRPHLSGVVANEKGYEATFEIIESNTQSVIGHVTKQISDADLVAVVTKQRIKEAAKKGSVTLRIKPTSIEETIVDGITVRYDLYRGDIKVGSGSTNNFDVRVFEQMFGADSAQIHELLRREGGVYFDKEEDDDE